MRICERVLRFFSYGKKGFNVCTSDRLELSIRYSVEDEDFCAVVAALLAHARGADMPLFKSIILANSKANRHLVALHIMSGMRWRENLHWLTDEAFHAAVFATLVCLQRAGVGNALVIREVVKRLADAEGAERRRLLIKDKYCESEEEDESKSSE